jgi:Zn-dependent peptidase ImmA (M78 family)
LSNFENGKVALDTSSVAAYNRRDTNGDVSRQYDIKVKTLPEENSSQPPMGGVLAGDKQVAKVRALVTPAVMQWARKTAGYTIEDAAYKIRRPTEDIVAWEEGTLLPTMPQARLAAKVYRRPLAVFYLEDPPRTFQPLQDFRQLPKASSRAYSPELAFLVRDTRCRQTWLHDYLVAEGSKPLDFVASADLGTPPQDLAATIRSTLGISTAEQRACRTKDATLRLWIHKAEKAGIFVFRQKTIGCEEGRGFVLCDSYAPFVFLNSQDARAAQVFTLAHELSHLWLGQSGISNLEDRGHTPNRSSDQIEIICNKVAAETLVGQHVFGKQWKLQDSADSLESRIENVAQFFKVSSEVVARRLLDAKEISRSRYEGLRRQYQQRWQDLRKRRAEAHRSSDRGPTYYRVKVPRDGMAFTQTVLGAYYSGSLSGRDTANLLDVKLNNLTKLAIEARVPSRKRGGSVA